MKRCLLDSNFLMAPYQFKVDVIKEIKGLGYEPLVLSCVLEELKKLAEKRSKEGKAAKIALELIRKRRLMIVDYSDNDTDSALVEYAKKNGCAVATNDSRLIKKAREKGIMILRLRQKKLIAED